MLSFNYQVRQFISRVVSPGVKLSDRVVIKIGLIERYTNCNKEKHCGENLTTVFDVQDKIFGLKQMN